MRIQHNIAALSAYRNLTNNNSAVSKSLEKLSSGYRINRAGDDAAGLAISEKMRAQITGLKTAQKNANDGISLVQTAEGAMTEVHSMLNRMIELANQSANGTYADEVDRENLQKEVASLKDEINRIADSTNFNGINLLDGSLDADSTANISDASAISNIQTSEYSPKGAAEAISTKYIINRPEASTTQTNASFTVKFDDVKLGTASDTDGNNKYTVKVGDWEVSIDSGAKTAVAGSDIVTALMKNGYKAATGKTVGTDMKEQTNNAAGVDKADTKSWTDNLTKGDGTDAAIYAKIDNHWYKMEAGAAADEVKFTQVDYSGDGGEVITPDFDVSVTRTSGGKLTGTTNWKVQDTVTGKGVGTTQQAQVEVNIDFSKLKDGDTLTAGDKTYTFKIGEGSTTTGTNTIDLTNIFKEASDLSDADKQALAMVKITGDIGTANSTAWSTGNGGVSEGVGKLTFQSLSTYADDAQKIGGVTTNDKVNMTTEANVMKQFYGESKEAAASVSFDLDVTKLKAGDTIKIDDVTFEFTDGTRTSSEDNIAVDLSSLGIANGLLASQRSDVTTALKNAIDTNLLAAGSNSTKYTTSIDGSTIKLTSKDVAATTKKEDRIAADITLSSSAYKGDSLTLQIGDTADSFNQLQVNVKDMHTAGMGIDDIDISTINGAKEAVDKIKSAINYVSSTRGDLGAIQNRLEHTINNLSVTTENMTAAESRIRDVDMAEEMMAYTKNNILVQAAQAMLAQANQIPQGVLQLLQ